MAATLVYYHLPSDRDDAEHPNAFSVPMQAMDITLRDVKKAFPLPGKYHFRFKVDGGFWLDFTDNDAHVPLFGQKRIVAKVLRLSWTNVDSAEPTLPQKPSPPPSMDLFSSTPTALPTRTEKPKNNVSDFDLFN